MRLTDLVNPLYTHYLVKFLRYRKGFSSLKPLLAFSGYPCYTDGEAGNVVFLEGSLKV